MPDITDPWLCALLGVVGALFSEGAKQFQKWQTLDDSVFVSQFRSLKFWFLFGFLAASGGLVAWLFYLDTGGSMSALACVAAGAGSLAFFRNGGSAIVAGQPAQRGFAGRTAKVSWRDILT